MINAQNLITRVNKVLADVNATSRVVYKRVQTTTGGDPLLGKGGTTTTVDTQLIPPPAVMDEDQKSSLVLSSSGRFVASDIFLTVSSTALTRAELENPKLTLVLKNGAHQDEGKILHYYDDTVSGTVIIWNIVVRLNK